MWFLNRLIWRFEAFLLVGRHTVDKVKQPAASETVPTR